MVSKASTGFRQGSASFVNIIVIALVAALGGLLFGYNTGIIGVALLGLVKDYHLTSFYQQIITSSLILGALFGCLLTGPVADRFGRRPVIIILAALFVVGAIFSSVASSVTMLIFWRFVLGLPTGGATQVVPVYIAEMAPSEHRGKLVASFQVMVVIGIVIAYLTGFTLGDHWRWMFALGAFPAIALLIGMILLPESPRWLVMKNREPEAIAIFIKLRGDTEAVQMEIETIRQISKQPQGGWKAMFQAWIFPAILISFCLSMFTQITGNNALVYYAPTIFTQAGFSSNIAVLGTTFSMVLVVIMTIVGSVLVDKVGRRCYLLMTIPVSVIALIVMGYLFMGQGPQTNAAKMTMVVCLCIYMMFNCGGFGVCVWLITAEIFPAFVRGKGASIGAFSNWFFTLVVSLTTLSLVNDLGPSFTFWLYAGISVIALLFIFYLIPETKGKTLEAIETELKEHRFYAYQQKKH